MIDTLDHQIVARRFKLHPVSSNKLPRAASLLQQLTHYVHSSYILEPNHERLFCWLLITSVLFLCEFYFKQPSTLSSSLKQQQ